MIDVGAFSTRPGAAPVSEEEETERLRRGLAIVRREQPGAVLSVDTFRPDVARMAVEEYGVAMINDVSGGNPEGAFGGTELREGAYRTPGEGDVPPIFAMAARLGVPYILMSSRPSLMSILQECSAKVQLLHSLGVKDIILDPGFGFGKTLEENYAIMHGLEQLGALGLPVLVGVSRKSMVTRLLGCTAGEALAGTTALHAIALMKGAAILRVHDVEGGRRLREAGGSAHSKQQKPQTKTDSLMFFSFGIKDVIDIFLVALMLYYLYRLMKDSRSLNVFIGIMVFVLLWIFVSQILEMRLLGSIMDKLVSVGVIGLIILFQEDIRKFLYNLGAHQRMRLLLRFFSADRAASKEKDKETIVPIVLACMGMSKRKVGALIVIERTAPLDDVAATGDIIDANINQRLIENIFFKNSPLHDGAMVISKKRIKAAGCILPVSHNLDIPKELGLRHRAALGISQQCDCIAIVVSEETGGISIAKDGAFQLRLSAEKLESILTTELDPQRTGR